MANKHRGEVKLKLGKNEWTMRPTFQAMAQIEDLTNTTIRILLAQTAMETARATDYVAVFYAGIKAADPDDDVTMDQLGNLIMEHGGLKTVRPQLVAFFEGLARFYGPGEERPDQDDDDDQKKT